MGVITPIAPSLLKTILELDGFKVVQEDDLNWALANNPSGEPVIIPKSGDEVSVDVMENALIATGLSNGKYFALRNKTLGVNPELLIN